MFWRKKTAATNNINTVEDIITEDNDNNQSEDADFNADQLQQHPQVLLKSTSHNLCAAMTYSISIMIHLLLCFITII